MERLAVGFLVSYKQRKQAEIEACIKLIYSSSKFLLSLSLRSLIGFEWIYRTHHFLSDKISAEVF